MITRLLRILLGLGVLLIIGLVVAATYFNFFVSRLEVADLLLHISGVTLFAFLMVLILRYLAMLIMAFIQHLRQMALPVRGDETPSVTVIVPAYNESRVIQASIESLMELNYPNFEVVVVDDGSTDDTFERAESIARQYPGGRVRVLTQANGGKSAALNMGIAHARGEFVLCMDADSRLVPDTLLHAMKHFSDPKVAAVAGNVKVANRLSLLTRLQALEYMEGLNLVRIAHSSIGRVSVIPGPVGVFRKSVLQELGGYLGDTYAEDCELTLRIVMAGHAIRHEPEAIAWTEAPETSDGLFQQRYRWARGILQAVMKHRSHLLRPFPNPGNWLLLWFLTFESVVLPAMNLLGMLVFILCGLGGGLSFLVPLWWAQLTMLDVVIALFCVSMEAESLSLVWYAIPYRLFYVPYTDVMKFFAWLDEVYGVRMGWMSVERIGRI